MRANPILECGSRSSRLPGAIIATIVVRANGSSSPPLIAESAEMTNERKCGDVKIAILPS